MRIHRSSLPRAATWLAGVVLAAATVALAGCDRHERTMHYRPYHEDVVVYRAPRTVVVHRPARRARPRVWERRKDQGGPRDARRHH